VAVDCGFHHFIVDIREEFGNYVIDNFVDEYMAGRTPNPCVLCNTHIKWEAMLRRADALDCEFIATGHYAKIKHENDRYFVSKAVDLHKDQSYVLWGLSQACMARSRFPLAEFTKPEVRKMAHDRGYTDLAKKGESYEICFVPDNDYRGFLRRQVDGLDTQVAGGNFINTSGEVLGQHKGYPFYTVGQRRGLGIALGEPIYVKEIIPETNTVVLGKEKELFRNGMTVGQLNCLKYETIPNGIESTTQIRYNDPGTLSTLTNNGDTIQVDFYANVKGVAPGQSAVFYEGDDVMGGGIIRR